MGNSVNDVKELFKKCDSLFGMRFDVLELKKLVSHKGDTKREYEINERKNKEFRNINVEFFSDEVKTMLSTLVKDAVKEALSEVLKERGGNI